VPALGDDFIVRHDDVTEIIKDWGLNTSTPLFYKRPTSISGSLLYNDIFLDQYLAKVGFNTDPQTKDYFKSNFTVYSFSCVQMWNMLVRELIGGIKQFHDKHKGAKTVSDISGHVITFDNGDKIEYDQLISTVPHNALCDMIKILDPNIYQDVYYYYIQDDNIDLEGANQALVCDPEIPFHKCTKITKNKYLFEIIDDYYENIYEVLMPILGGGIEIINASVVQNAHITKGVENPLIKQQDITCVGSYAQCDPLIDLSSVIKRVHNLLKRQAINQ
jgi:hypothetical protein